MRRPTNLYCVSHLDEGQPVGLLSQGRPAALPPQLSLHGLSAAILHQGPLLLLLLEDHPELLRHLAQSNQRWNGILLLPFLE